MRERKWRVFVRRGSLFSFEKGDGETVAKKKGFLVRDRPLSPNRPRLCAYGRIETSVPIGTDRKSWAAASEGRRMHPCDAG